MSDIAVKALEWTQGDNDPSYHFAQSSIGNYIITEFADDGPRFRLLGTSQYGVWFNTLADAQAAAQSDFDARIRSAIEPVGQWRDGAPPKPWCDEWFIAETTYGDRVVLTSLPEDWTYDFKTADDTYIKADRIKRWMQFPDSEFSTPPAAAVTFDPDEWRDEMSAISSYLGAGMGDDQSTAADLAKRIRWGIDEHVNGTIRMCASVVERLSQDKPYSHWGEVKSAILELAQSDAVHCAQRLEFLSASPSPVDSRDDRDFEWKLVPIKPTLEMAEKGAEAFSLPHPQSVGAENERAALIYRLMLGASPVPAQPIEAAEKWRLFPKKTPEEVDRDPVYREASRQLKPLRDAFMLPASPSPVDSRDGLITDAMVKALEEIAASRRMNCHEMSDEERAEYWSELALRYRSIASKALAAKEQQP